MAVEWIRRRFVAEVVPACLRLGATLPEALHLCAVGAAISDWGRVTPGCNYWGATQGDHGPIVLVTPIRHDNIATGGISPHIEPIGWWSTIDAAVADAVKRGALQCAVPAAEWQEARRLWGGGA